MMRLRAVRVVNDGDVLGEEVMRMRGSARKGDGQ